MLRTLMSVTGFEIQAKDGKLGKIRDFFFDDRDFTIRYFVVDTGEWLSGREVLIPRSAVGRPDWPQEFVPVKLSRQQVESSPPIETHEPVSRQKEMELHEHLGLTGYWEGRSPSGLGEIIEYEDDHNRPPEPENHLRSVRELTRYRIKVTDDELGHADDFIVDENDWIIRYLVVDTGNWLPGRHVLVAMSWISEISWEESNIHVDLDRETIKNAPPYNPENPIDREYEHILHDYYRRRKYWEPEKAAR